MSTAYRIGDYEFSTRELRDLLIAWLALGSLRHLLCCAPDPRALGPGVSSYSA
jgi:hypothetical protein